jgi:AcrR family transcriptional regulator
MKSEFHERRVQRTRLLIQQTFIDLVGEQGFESVTIRDITDRAKINRGTFYLHYLDKFDLMDQMKDHYFNGITEIIKSMNIEAFLRSGEDKVAPSFAVILLDYFQMHHRFLKVMLGPNGDVAFMERMKHFLQLNLSRQIDNLHQTSNPSLPAEFVISYISSAHLGVLQHWLNSGMKQSPNELASIIYQLTSQGPLRAYFNSV